MKRRFPTLAMLATLVLGFGLAGPTGAASAMTAPAAARAALASDAQQPAAEQAGYRERGRHHRDWRRHDRRHWQNDWRRHDPWRGQRYHRPRGSIHFHFGTPAPRFHAPPRHRGHVVVLPRAHVSWCQSRYRSYRAWDNTFQPYRGPRRQCVSVFF